MLNSEVDALLDVAVLDLLVDDDSNSALCNVVDNASLAVVDFVWKTVSPHSQLLLIYERESKSNYSPFLNRAIGLDVNDISDLVLA